MAHPRAEGWCDVTYRRLAELAEDKRSGIRMTSGIEAAHSPVTPPAWASKLPTYQLVDAAELPGGYAMGWRYTAPLVDMTRYLLFLTDWLRMYGVTIEQGRVAALPDMAGRADVVVNCTGLGARELVGDPELAPTRGQLVVMKNPGVTSFFQEYEDDENAKATREPGEMTYYLPHGPVVVLGGYARRDSESLVPSAEMRERIIRRCAEVEPLLSKAEFIADKVGLRPTRTLTRVEAEVIHGQHVVHNYGHGGVGLTLSWGCAEEVRDLIEKRVDG